MHWLMENKVNHIIPWFSWGKKKSIMASHKCIIVTDFKDQGTDFEMPIAITYSIKEKKNQEGVIARKKCTNWEHWLHILQIKKMHRSLLEWSMSTKKTQSLQFSFSKKSYKYNNFCIYTYFLSRKNYTYKQIEYTK